jgi:putative hemolysin
VLSGFSVELLLGPLTLLVLLACSGFISGAEVAFFSLSRSDVEGMENEAGASQRKAAALIKRPKRLLATILIANNFVNVGIIILSTYLIAMHVPKHVLAFQLFGVLPVMRIIEVFGITTVVLLAGEIMPKIYAGQYAVRFATFMAYPLHVLSIAFSFLSIPLIKLTNIIDKRASTLQEHLSVDELSHALDLTMPSGKRELEDRKILEGIVQFGNTDVKQIMRPRPDVEAVESSTPFTTMLAQILESGYSRVPVFKESLDNIIGILHVKDLLPHMFEADDFDWRTLVRSPFFVPESKMIDDLLEEFRQRKVHMAVVVDEYGGCEGVVTLEDIMEEIVGEISDEFDDDEVVYSKLDDTHYVFEGKTNLRQFYRVLQIDGERFEDHKGEADTLAGFVLEQAGRIPHKNQSIRFGRYEFTVESVDKRRIKRLKVAILSDEGAEERDSDAGISGNRTSMMVLLALAIGLAACGDDFTPKPRGHLRIDLPEKSYAPVATDCPFSFEQPTYAVFEPDMRTGSSPCWFDLHVPQFKARVHFSYKPVKGNLIEYLEDARAMTNKHMSKATGIEEQLIINADERVFGMYWKVAGSGAASPIQLYLTDSTDHFLRGALYFNVVPNNDSLAPVIQFLDEDLQHLVETFRWRR